MRIQNTDREYVAKLNEQKDEIISTTSRRNSSHISSHSSVHRDTLVNIKATKAALEKSMQYFKLIAEQERKLEQLKMQGEYEEVSAQENVYETLTDAIALESCLSVTLPTEKHDIMTTFLGETDNVSFISKERRKSTSRRTTSRIFHSQGADPFAIPTHRR